MRRIRRGLKRLWRMSDPYYAAKDDGLVTLPSGRKIPATHWSKQAQFDLTNCDEPDWDEDPSYDWVAETRRAKELRKAGGHGQEI
jgi:hypothetical protein